MMESDQEKSSASTTSQEKAADLMEMPTVSTGDVGQTHSRMKKTCHHPGHQGEKNILLQQDVKDAHKSTMTEGSTHLNKSATKTSQHRKKNASDTSSEKDLLVYVDATDISASSSRDGNIKDTCVQGRPASVQHVHPGDNIAGGSCLKTIPCDEDVLQPSNKRALGHHGHKRFKSTHAFADECNEKRLLLNCSTTPEGVCDRLKRRKTSVTEAEVPVSSEETALQKNGDKQSMLVSLNTQEMKNSHFWPPKLENTFTWSKSGRFNLDFSNAQKMSNSANTFTLQDGTEVHTVWERDGAIQEITRISNTGHETMENGGQITKTIILPSGSRITVIENGCFWQYALSVHFLMNKWAGSANLEQEDMFLRIGKYLLRLQKNDFYVVPQYMYSDGHYQTIEFHKRNLSYAKLNPTKHVNKRYSEALFNYIMGNHNKVVSSVKSPDDAIAIGAVLFSEVIRNPEMFFHNFELLYLLKSWGDFRCHHPMVTGGSWKHQADRGNLPQKVIKKTRQNHGKFMERFFNGKSLNAIAG